MTKNEKTALYIFGGLVLVGGGATAIYFATRPKQTATPALKNGAVEKGGAIDVSMKNESEIDASRPTDADTLQQQQQQQTQPPPQIQLPKNLNQI